MSEATPTKSTAQQDAKHTVQGAQASTLGRRIQRSVWILVLLAVGSSLSVWIWQVQTYSLDTRAQLQALSQLSERLDQQDEALQQLQEQWSNLSALQANFGRDLTRLAAQVSSSDQSVKAAWLLAELEYLLNLANQRLVLAKDPLGAEQALDMADRLLENTTDFRLQPLRSLIADAELALASMTRVDRAGILAELDGAIERLPSLRLAHVAPEESSVKRVVYVTPTQSGWRAHLASVWSQIKQLVVIRYDAHDAQQLLSPEQGYFVRRYLQLQFQSARLALVANEQALFQASLQQARTALQNDFSGAERDAYLALIAQIEAEFVEQVLPDITAPLLWIQGLTP